MVGLYLKCDAEGCDHREHVGELDEAHIGKTCPKCGANLLTQEDYMLAKAVLMTAVDLLIGIGLAAPAEEGSGGVSFNAHNGTIKIAEKAS